METPPSEQQTDLGASDLQPPADEQFQSYGYQLPVMWDHEDIDSYCVGGLHPVTMNDTLDDGRYKVVRKLGAGGFATVWLCRDQEEGKWVAIKILGADASLNAAQCQIGEMAVLKHFRDLDVSEEELQVHHICLAQEFFIERGPNGKHFCFILPVLGGDIREVWKDYAHDPEVLRGICAQMVTAMQYLHSKGVCHGDFRPANILYTDDRIEHATEEEISEMFPECEEEELGPVPATGEEPSPQLPRFIYSSTSLSRRSDQKKINIVVSDFGEAYLIDNPPWSLGIPLKYAAPEVILNPGLGFDHATDVWALAASILEVRHNKNFVSDMSIVKAVESWEESLGPLPEPYRYVWFENDYRGRGIPLDAEIPLSEPVSLSAQRMKDKKTRALGSRHANLLEKIIREPAGLGVRILPGEDVSASPGQRQTGNGTHKWMEYQIPADEADGLFDLLSRIFKYSPEERLTLSEIVAHPWFTGKFASESSQDNDTDTAVEVVVNEIVDMVVDQVPGPDEMEIVIDEQPDDFHDPHTNALQFLEHAPAAVSVEADTEQAKIVPQPEQSFPFCTVEEVQDPTMVVIDLGAHPVTAQVEDHDKDVFYDAQEGQARQAGAVQVRGFGAVVYVFSRIKEFILIIFGARPDRYSG
ncbi:kinase-like domain-containing protein [Coniochaeta sp. 2T2.1]|nr:kinase-like domain-containing protein [Coniochaeta sp. 2T2.1]